MHHPLSTQDLLAFGPLRRLGREIFLHSDTASTNDFLRSKIAEATDGAIACAEFQSCGRGRQGRSWRAPRGSSVLLSVLLREPATSPLVPRAAMLAALAACEAIEQSTDCRPRLRWPNDIVISSRKLGGVLAETSSLPPRHAQSPARRAVIIGIGINCLQQQGHFDEELARKATSLEIESNEPVDRARVAGKLIERLDAQLADADDAVAEWPRVRSSWKYRCDDIGAHATLRHDTQPYSGTVLDIDDDGDLIVQLDRGGRRRFGSATTTRIW